MSTTQTPSALEAIGTLAQSARHGEWSFCLVGEDQSQKLAQITSDLTAPHSATGDGKRIASGYSYWGVESTMAWIHACTDLYYPVMRDSIASFERRLTVGDEMEGAPDYHYVTLGVGTGEKDNAVLRLLCTRRSPRDVRFVPVDVSMEMLRHGTRNALRGNGLPYANTLPVQLDFASHKNLRALRELVDGIAGSEPVLFSLLGNTLANFDDDARRLRDMARTLLRPGDHFLLEVASTNRLDQYAAAKAAQEYQSSPRFSEFVTSALLHYTDLQIDGRSVEFQGDVEGDKALKIKILYRNRTGQTLRPLLPNRTTFDFPDGDTVRLYTTRKYGSPGLDQMIAEAGLRIVSDHGHHDDDATEGVNPFGLRLLLLELGDNPPPDDGPNPFDSRP